MPPLEMNMGVGLTVELPNDVIQPQGKRASAGDPPEPMAQPRTQGNAQPGHSKSERGGEGRMAGRGDRGDGEGLEPVPVLHPRGENKWQPVGRDGRVKKGNPEAGDRNRG